MGHETVDSSLMQHGMGNEVLEIQLSINNSVVYVALVRLVQHCLINVKLFDG